MIHSAQGESSSCQRKFLLQPFYFFGEPLCWFPDHAHSAVAPVFHQCTGGKLLVNSGWTKNFSTASHAPSITSRIALCWRSGPQFRPTSLLRCIDSQWTLFDIQCSEEAHPVVRVLTGQLFRSEAIQKAQSPGDYGLCPFLRNSDSEERKSRFSANEVTSNTKLPDVRKRQPKSSKAYAQTKPKVKLGDPVQFEPGVLGDVPTYARLNQYTRAQHAVKLAYMAHAGLPKEIANAITVSLISEVPALQAAVAIQAYRKKEGQGYRTSVGAIA